MKFSDHELVSNVSSATLLRLDIDSHSSFSQHVDKICKKLSQRIALLRKIRVYLSLRKSLLYENSIVDHFTVVAKLSGLRMGTRLPVTLF